MDKLLAPFYAECCCMIGRNEMTNESKEYLRKAYHIAVRFDAAPTFGVKSLKFCIGETKNATAFDSMGSTAITAVENALHNEDSTDEILQFWEELKNGTI